MTDSISSMIKKICKEARGIVLFIIMVVLITGSSSENTPGTQDPQNNRNAETKIASARNELAKIKTERKESGKDEDLKLLDAIKPEVALPPILALVSDDLKEYDIDSAALSEKIKADPSQFRKKVPEHLRVRFLLFSPEEEQKIGDKIEAELIAEGKIYNDEKEFARVKTIVDKIAEQLPNPIPIRAYLYKDDTINAFCILNGSVFVHSGLLNNAPNDDMLAFVLAHELGHLAARHTNETVTDWMFLDAGDVFAKSKEIKLKKEGNFIKGLILRASYLGGSYAGVLLPFERKMESEADTLGIRYMARAGYDPRAAVDFFKKIQEERSNIPAWVNFLSDHPADEKRIESMEKECENLKKGKNLKPPLLDRVLKSTKKENE